MLHINQKGRSMIEMLGVLAIVGVLSVGGIAGYSKAMSKYRINKAIDQISQLAQNIRILYGNQKTYSSLSSNVIQRAHLAPDEMYEGTGGSMLTNPFGGSVWVQSSWKVYSGDAKAFYMYMTDVPQEACVEIISQDWGSESGSGLIGIGNSSVTSLSYGCTSQSDYYTCANAGVMPMNKAIIACSNPTNNTIYWKFY